MASTSSSRQQNTLFRIVPPHQERKVKESYKLYDVFINHRGPDVKQTLATDLYNFLKELNIRTFLDSEERTLGHSFISTIETAINSALVQIAIFSKRYAQSPWCLAELVLMLQSKAKIIPVFYQVEPLEVKPNDLRYVDKGVFKDAFLEYVRKDRYLDKIEEWKKALQKISYTTGYEFKSSSDCKEIVSAVEKEIKRTQHLHVSDYPVGLYKLAEDFERKCKINRAGKAKANIVGICGMGGVGKTTLSKELFNQKRSQYRSASFLFDIREASASAKQCDRQSKLLSDLFDETDEKFQCLDEGRSCLSNRFERSDSLNFLIVLDDVDHLDQLEALIPLDILDARGDSLVIITTRDVGVLVSARIGIRYHLQGLDGEEGQQLFSWHAFRQQSPDSGYEDLVKDFVNACGGLPLSFQVLGRHLCHNPF